MYTLFVHLSFVKLCTRNMGDLNIMEKSVPGFHANFVAVFQTKNSILAATACECLN